MGFQSASQKSSSSGLSSGMGVNQSIAGTDIWGQQIPGMAQLYGQAMGLQSAQQSQVGNAANSLLGSLMPGANSGIGALQSIAGGGSPIEQYANPNNALARTQLDQMTEQISTNFGRSILPQIRQGAGLAGGVGSSREALAQGVAAGDASRAIADAGTNLYSQQYGIGAQAAAGATDARLTAAQALPGAATQAFNLGMGGFQQQWAPLLALMQIMGNPQMLSRQVSSGVDLSSNRQSQSGKSSSFGLSLS